MAPGIIRFQAPQLPPVEAIAAYYARSERARRYTNSGPCHALLVERLEAFLGGGVRCVPVANGTLGLMVALRAMAPRTPDRLEVLMPSFTFAATIDAVLWAGLRPVFVDVEDAGWHLDPVALRAALAARGPRVAAVLACSTFGVPPPVAQRRAWEQAALDAEVPLLVDSAAGFGAVDGDGRTLGGQGDAEVFSFHATKPFAIGEGGLVTASGDAVTARMTRLSNFGFDHGVVHEDVGLNAKLSEWGAATALATLDRFRDVLAGRRATAARMLGPLIEAGYRVQAGNQGAAWQFVPVLARTPGVRSAALAAAERAGVELRSYFNVPLHRMPAFAAVPAAGELHRTDALASRVLSLPMANDLGRDAVDRIVEVLLAVAPATGAPVR